MGIEYRLVNKSKNQTLDLGRGDWSSLFNTPQDGFLLSNLAKDQSELATKISLALKEKPLDVCKQVADQIWNFSGSDTIYFGNDNQGIFDEDGQELLYPLTSLIKNS